MKEIRKIEQIHIWFFVLIALNILLTLFVIVRKDPSWKLEEMKAGWAENFAMVQQLYSSEQYVKQQKDSINQFLGSIQWDNGNQPELDNNPTKWPDQWIVEKLNNIRQDWYILGNPEAQITILEYSDILCPFCKRQSQEWTLEQVLEKYEGKVNKIFRQFPIVSLHPTAPKVSEWVECAGDLWWTEKYYEYLVKIFIADDFSEAWLKKLAKDIGLKSSDFDSCLDSGKFKSKVDAQIQEWQWFGVTWTPGNVIVNSLNWEYVVVAWAYPVSKFVEEIDKMLSR
jgi:protein-disulfide isomerase